MLKKFFNQKQGFSLVELVVAVAIFMIVAGSMSALSIGTHLSRLENAERVKAGLILTETWEAVRAIRNADWADITNGSHGLTYTNGFWEFSGESDTTDGITRQVVITDVQRDDGGALVAEGGAVDVDTKAIQILLSWSPYAENEQTMTVDTYLTNYENASEWP